jgi:hypothetical protein
LLSLEIVCANPFDAMDGQPDDVLGELSLTSRFEFIEKGHEIRVVGWEVRIG